MLSRFRRRSTEAAEPPLFVGDGEAVLGEMFKWMQREGSALGMSAEKSLRLSADTAAFCSGALRDAQREAKTDAAALDPGLVRAVQRQLLFVTHVRLEEKRRGSSRSTGSFSSTGRGSRTLSFFSSSGHEDTSGESQGPSRSDADSAEQPPLSLSIFPALQHLVLEGIPIDRVDQLLPLRAQLKGISLRRSPIVSLADALLRGAGEVRGAGQNGRATEDLLAAAADPGESVALLSSMPASMTPPITWQWRALRELEITDCGLQALDASIRLAPHVSTLLLTRNALCALPASLSFCTDLVHLDLSGNIGLGPVLGMAPECIGAVRVLKLRRCCLRSCVGLDRLLALEEIDLRDNSISEFAEVNRVASLPFLRSLDLRGCPVCSSRRYRIRVLALLQPFRRQLAPVGRVASDRADVLPTSVPPKGRREREEAVIHLMDTFELFEDAESLPVLDAEPISPAEGEKLAALAGIARRARKWRAAAEAQSVPGLSAGVTTSSIVFLNDQGQASAEPPEPPTEAEVEELLGFSPFFYTYSRAKLGKGAVVATTVPADGQEPAAGREGLAGTADGDEEGKTRGAVHGTLRPGASLSEVRESLAQLAHQHYRATHGREGATPERPLKEATDEVLWRKTSSSLYILSERTGQVGWRRGNLARGSVPKDATDATDASDGTTTRPSVHATSTKVPQFHRAGARQARIGERPVSARAEQEMDPVGGFDAPANGHGEAAEDEADALAVAPFMAATADAHPPRDSEIDVGEALGAGGGDHLSSQSDEDRTLLVGKVPADSETFADGGGRASPFSSFADDQDINVSEMPSFGVAPYNGVGAGMDLPAPGEDVFDSFTEDAGASAVAALSLTEAGASSQEQEIETGSPLLSSFHDGDSSEFGQSLHSLEMQESDNDSEQNSKDALMAMIEDFHMAVQESPKLALVGEDMKKKFGAEARSEPSDAKVGVPEREKINDGHAAASAGPAVRDDRGGAQVELRSSKEDSKGEMEKDSEAASSRGRRGGGFGARVREASSWDSRQRHTSRMRETSRGEDPLTARSSQGSRSVLRPLEGSAEDNGKLTELDAEQSAEAEEVRSYGRAILNASQDKPRAGVGIGRMPSTEASSEPALDASIASRESPFSSPVRASDSPVRASGSADDGLSSDRVGFISVATEDHPYGTYVGEDKYRDLNVRDNLKLYFKQNIFTSKAGTLRETCRGLEFFEQHHTLDASGDGAEASEELFELFRVPVLPVKPVPGSGAARSLDIVPNRTARGETPKDGNDLSERALLALENYAVLLVTDRMLYLVEDLWDKVDSSSWSRQKHLQHSVEAILTAGSAREGESCRFGDAPRPRILAAHGLASLSRVSIGFGFQRVSFAFRSRAAVLGRPGLSPETASTAPSLAYDCAGVWNEQSEDTPADREREYVLCPRSRSVTHALATKVPKMASSARQQLKFKALYDGHDDVVYENEDPIVLQQISEMLAAGPEAQPPPSRKVARRNSAHAPLCYMMVYQRWKTRAGILCPRTLIVTESGVMLCDEDFARAWASAHLESERRSAESALHSMRLMFSTEDASPTNSTPRASIESDPWARRDASRAVESDAARVRLKLVEAAPFSDVLYVRPDTEPHCFSIRLRTPFFGRKRKWRLVCVNREQAEKAVNELRRLCTALGSSGETPSDDD